MESISGDVTYFLGIRDGHCLNERVERLNDGRARRRQLHLHGLWHGCAHQDVRDRVEQAQILGLELNKVLLGVGVVATGRRLQRHLKIVLLVDN